MQALLRTALCGVCPGLQILSSAERSSAGGAEGYDPFHRKRGRSGRTKSAIRLFGERKRTLCRASTSDNLAKRPRAKGPAHNSPGLRCDAAPGYCISGPSACFAQYKSLTARTSSSGDGKASSGRHQSDFLGSHQDGGVKNSRNPKGVPVHSPGLRRRRYPGYADLFEYQPCKGCAKTWYCCIVRNPFWGCRLRVCLPGVGAKRANPGLCT